jgi:hypothetical protein
MRTTCLAHLIFLDFIILISEEVCKLWSLSLCSFLPPPVSTLSSAHCSQTPSIYVPPLMWER